MGRARCASSRWRARNGRPWRRAASESCCSQSRRRTARRLRRTCANRETVRRWCTCSKSSLSSFSRSSTPTCARHTWSRSNRSASSSLCASLSSPSCRGTRPRWRRLQRAHDKSATFARHPFSTGTGRVACRVASGRCASPATGRASGGAPRGGSVHSARLGERRSPHVSAPALAGWLCHLTGPSNDRKCRVAEAKAAAARPAASSLDVGPIGRKGASSATRTKGRISRCRTG
mmetsp:Transcript_15125/g.36166  ORF Transcript_15125/g.36166 Transcript_15125/m.36166 type:complete len:233 (+) Transcript_15125:1706-2404(+)